MNHAKNFKIANIFSRIAAFIIYFSASGFAGAICRTIFDSFMRIALRNNPELKNLILYLVSLCVIFLALFYFSKREGFNDTQELRFSVFKTLLCYFISGIIFFTGAVCLDIYVFGHENFFRQYFFSPYYLDEHINNLTQSFPENNSYFISGLFVLLNTGSMTYAYIAGRAKWIKNKNKLLKNMRENKKA